MIIDVSDCGIYTVVCLLHALFMSCILGGYDQQGCFIGLHCARGYETVSK